MFQLAVDGIYVGAAIHGLVMLAGKTCLITGSTDGIGRYTAKKLAELNAKIIIHGRNQTRIDDTIREIQKETGNSDIQGYNYDLSSLEQTRSFAELIRSNHPKIDILINNAAVFQTDKKTTEEGYEYTWALNVLSPYLLCCLLVDCVQSRIINVASISAANSIDFDNLQQQKGYDMHNAYSLSKLCVILMTFFMAEKMHSVSSVTVNTLDPGTVNTKMLYAGWGNIGIDINQANDEFYLATEKSLSKTSGKYFVGQRLTSPPRVAEDVQNQERLIRILEEQTGEKFSPSPNN